MRCTIIFLILAIVLGVVLPYFVQDRFVGMALTLPTFRGSASPAREFQISETALLWFLRGLGVCFALLAIYCFVSYRNES